MDFVECCMKFSFSWVLEGQPFRRPGMTSDRMAERQNAMDDFLERRMFFPKPVPRFFALANWLKAPAA
ncbi:hypothetical protein [Roseovarius indicus]|uniref:hypothetical protein n=1 Tax=Roseovarius indicus TaxID=540747 RepID=UPI001365350B|nr:hypothetical protein [Roseovarius indicus]